MKHRDDPWCPPFIPMSKVLKPRSRGGWILGSMTLTEKEVRRARLMAAMSFSFGEYVGLRPGTYMRLRVPESMSLYGNRVMMTDTPREREMNMEIVEKAHGRVLIAGLGIGMILLPILLKSEVERVVVVEKYADVMHMVVPQIKSWARMHHDPSKNTCISKLYFWCGNIHDYSKDDKFNVIYFDIWAEPDEHAYKETKVLWKEFRKSLDRSDPKHWMGAWRRDEMRRCALG